MSDFYQQEWHLRDRIREGTVLLDVSPIDLCSSIEWLVLTLFKHTLTNVLNALLERLDSFNSHHCFWSIE